MAKKRTRRNYQQQADLLFSAAVRGIGYCEECGTTEHLQCAHIVSRGYSRTRVNFENAVCLCRGCHTFYTPRPLHWDEWAQKRIGVELWTELRRLAIFGPEVDWRAEVERLRSDVPMMRAEPLRLYRGR